MQLELIEDLRQFYWEQKTQGVLETIADSKTRSAILGDPDSRKSSLLQYIALAWAKKTNTERYQERLPLFAELRLYGDDKECGNCKGLLDFFHINDSIPTRPICKEFSRIFIITFRRGSDFTKS